MPLRVVDGWPTSPQAGRSRPINTLASIPALIDDLSQRSCKLVQGFLERLLVNWAVQNADMVGPTSLDPNLGWRQVPDGLQLREDIFPVGRSPHIERSPGLARRRVTRFLLSATPSSVGISRLLVYPSSLFLEMRHWAQGSGLLHFHPNPLISPS